MVISEEFLQRYDLAHVVMKVETGFVLNQYKVQSNEDYGRALHYKLSDGKGALTY